MKTRHQLVLPLLLGLLATIAMSIMLSPQTTRAAVGMSPQAADPPALEYFTRTVSVAQAETAPASLEVSGDWVGWGETVLGCGHCGSYIVNLHFENILTSQKVDLKISTGELADGPFGITSMKMAAPYVVWSQPGKTGSGGGYLFSAGDFDCTICYYNLSTGKGGAVASLQKLDPTQTGSLHALDVSTSGQVLASLDGSSSLWASAIDSTANTEISTNLAPGAVVEAAFALFGRYVWIGSDRQVYINNTSGQGGNVVGTGADHLVSRGLYFFWHTDGGIQTYDGDPTGALPKPNGQVVVPGAGSNYDIQTTTNLGDIAAYTSSAITSTNLSTLNLVSFGISGGSVSTLLTHSQATSIGSVALEGDKMVYLETEFTPSFPTYSIQLVWLVRADPVFKTVWDKADAPVATGKVARSWLWGPQANYMGMETYTEGANSERLVRYYDKSRMEVNHANINTDDPYYVTNGLLVTEMIANEIQLGDNTFVKANVEATIPVAGDPRKDNPLTPGYAALRGVSSLHGENQSPNRVGKQVDAALDVNGTVSADSAHATLSKYAAFSPQTGHNIPDLFWTYLQGMQSAYGFDWTFVLGYPISEAYWTQMRVNGVDMPVMIQAYQRRVLTYVPGFELTWRVQMGNVGQHYFEWRYELNK